MEEKRPHAGDKRKALRNALNVRYKDATSRADVLGRLQDSDTRTKIKPPSQPPSQWPPKIYNGYSQPPRVKLPKGRFVIRSSPNMVEASYAEFKESNASALFEPLSAEDKTRFLDREQWRLLSASTRAHWDLDNDALNAQVDQAIYSGLMTNVFEPLLPIPCALMDLTDVYNNYNVPNYGLIALGPHEEFAGCLLRFLYLRHLDVCREIQDIAAANLTVSSFRNKATWSESSDSTPQMRKAQAIIEWVIHAARQTYTIPKGKVQRLKLSDGWNNIWFHFEGDTISVSSTMTPTCFDDPPAEAPMGLLHSVISLGYHAGLELVEYMNGLYKRAGCPLATEEEEREEGIDLKDAEISASKHESDGVPDGVHSVVKDEESATSPVKAVRPKAGKSDASSKSAKASGEQRRGKKRKRA